MRFLSFIALGALAILGCSDGSKQNDAGSGSDAAADVAQQPGDAKSDAPSSCFAESATVSGTFYGLTLTPKDAVSIFSTTNSNAFFVAISDYANLCATASGIKASSQILVFDYQGGATLPIGTPVDVTKTEGFDVQWAQYDQTCNTPQGESASSGTVTFSELDACGAAGTFDLVFNDDHVTGSFGAPACAYDPDAGAGKCN